MCHIHCRVQYPCLVGHIPVWLWGPLVPEAGSTQYGFFFWEIRGREIQHPHLQATRDISARGGVEVLGMQLVEELG